MPAKKQPKHVGTWVIVVDTDQTITKFGTSNDTQFPFPPDDKEAKSHVKWLCEQKEFEKHLLYIVHVFDNGQIKQYDVERNDFAKDVDFDPRPTFPEDAKWNSYNVSAIERFLVKTEYADVIARSEEEALWLVRNGHHAFEKPSIEEGSDEFIEATVDFVRAEDVGPPEDEDDDN